MKSILDKNSRMKTIENKEGVRIEEVLRHKFIDENKTIEQIADELKISYVTVHKWLSLAGIYSRKLRL
jgi:transposase